MKLPEDQSQFLSKHDAVLSRLEYWQNKDGNTHFYPKNEFESSLSTFENIPIIYASKHPITGLRGRNLEEVLKEVDGKVAGYNSQSLINNMGNPKLSTVLNITDPEVDKKIRNGGVSISPGFWYTAPQVGSLKNISGDHILLYPTSEGVPQGDIAAMILNQDNSNPDHSNNIQNETAYFGYLTGEIQLKNNQLKGATNLVEEKTLELNPYSELLKANQDVLLENKEVILKLNQDIEKEKETVLKLNQTIEEKDKLLLNQAEQLKVLGDQIKGIVEDQLKANQEANWNTFLEGTRDHFKDRKGELGDLNTALKLNTDMKTFEDNLEKNPQKDAQGDKHFKGNQDDDDSKAGIGKPTSYNPFTGKME